MEITLLIGVIVVIASVLQIVLFFKIWRMTNDVRAIMLYMRTNLFAGNTFTDNKGTTWRIQSIDANSKTAKCICDKYGIKDFPLNEITK